MAHSSAIKNFLVRERHPGDLVFAILFLLFSLFLLSQIGSETKWVKGTKLFTQPAFWPAVSLIFMTLFALGHFLGSIFSQKLKGRKEEILLWLKSIEYALWFLLYVWIVPIIGYLLATIFFTFLLTLRTGYYNKKTLIAAPLMSILIVVTFKGFLEVKIPGGQWYQYLPDGIRNFMLLYL